MIHPKDFATFDAYVDAVENSVICEHGLSSCDECHHGVHAAPKPDKSPKKPRKRVKARNAERGGTRYPERRDEAFLATIREMPCACCRAMGITQVTRTEVEHFVEKGRGGWDRGDTFPTCADHRELRHVIWGPRKFREHMLNHFGLDLRKLCTQLGEARA